MRRALFAVVFIALAAPPAGRAETDCCSGLRFTFTSARFEILANHAPLGDAARGDELRARLDRTAAAVLAFAGAHRLPAVPPRERLRICILDRRDAFDRCARAAGFQPAAFTPAFHDRAAGLTVLLDWHRQGPLAAPFATLRQAQPDRPAERQRLENIEQALLATVVQHEIAHHVLFATGIQNPRVPQPAWLTEGLATLFESHDLPPAASAITPDAARPAFGPLPNPLRLLDLRAAADAGRLLPTGRLLTEPALFDPAGPDAATAYAQAGATIRILCREPPHALADYLRRINARAPNSRPTADDERSDFEAAFGPIDRVDARVRTFARAIPPIGRPSAADSRPTSSPAP